MPIEQVGADGTIAVGKELFFTGLLQDPAPRVCHKAFADAMPMKTKAQIIKDIQALGTKWVPARQTFDASWILNQGQHNSCCPYALTAIAEKTIFRKDGRIVKLAPEGLYAQINGGRDQGAVLRTATDAAEGYGFPPRNMVQPGVYLKRDVSLEADRNAKRYRLGLDNVYGIHSDEELMNAIYSGWTVLLAVEVNGAWYKLDGRGVVAPTDGRGNHAIHADDLRVNDQGEIEYDHAGSWGQSYGQKGRGWITWARHLRTSCKYHEFRAVRTIIDDPDAPGLPTPA